MRRRDFLQAAASLSAAAGLAGSLRGADTKGPQPPKIKIGQIGVGHAHASGKMAALRNLPDDYEVVGVVEPDAALRARWEKHPIYRGVPWLSEQQLLNVPGLKAVAVETTVPDLVPTASRCVAAGMHLHLDKPGGHSLPAFRAMLEASHQKKLTVQMGYMYRNNHGFLLAWQALKEGWLGPISEVHAVISKLDPPAARAELVGRPGGVMFELGCHLIDAVVAVLGPPQKVVPFPRRVRQDLDPLVDNQLAVFEYPLATATIRATVVEVDGFQRRQFVISGREGTLEIRPIEPPKVLLSLRQPRGSYRKGTQEVPLAKMPGRYEGQLMELAQIIRGQKEHPFSIEHDLAAQEATMRASGML